MRRSVPLDPETLLSAYAQGAFPMSDRDGVIRWYTADPRGIFPLDQFHVPHTLAQLDGALAGLTAEQVATLVVAYEPVWAIGTGETATPEDAQELAAAIRTRIGELYDAATADAVRVLYGGSVKSSNVASIMAKPDVDGALVGGASLDPEEFAAIARYKSHAVGL